MVNFQPIRNMVLLRSIETDGVEQTKTGLFIPQVRDDNFHRAEVVAVGPGLYQNGDLVPCSVRPGMKVLYSKFFKVQEVILDGEALMLFTEDAIAGFETNTNRPIEVVHCPDFEKGGPLHRDCGGDGHYECKDCGHYMKTENTNA